jgi:hypothetical protein
MRNERYRASQRNRRIGKPDLEDPAPSGDGGASLLFGVAPPSPDGAGSYNALIPDPSHLIPHCSLLITQSSFQSGFRFSRNARSPS